MQEILPQHKIDATKISHMTIFPIQIASYVWEDSEKLNKELLEVILEREEEGAGRQQSNVGGWHSDWDVLTWDYPCIKEFVQRIHQMSGHIAKAHGLKDDDDVNLSLTGWANVMHPGGYHCSHIHPNNFWSGCYYIDDGDPYEEYQYSGDFEFTDPRGGAESHTYEGLDCWPRYRFTPKSGMVLMFPSYVRHYVHPYVGPRKRVTIAFNVRILQ